MSLKDIRQSSVTRLGTLFPSYLQLYNIFDVEDNDDRTLGLGFGVRWGEGLPATGPTRKYCLESSLVVILTRSIETRARDNKAILIDDIYEDVENVIQSFMNQTFLGIPEKFRGFRDATVSAPVLIGSNKFVKIEIDFTVNHLIDLNT